MGLCTHGVTTQVMLGVSLRVRRDIIQVMLGVSLRARYDITLVHLMSTAWATQSAPQENFHKTKCILPAKANLK